MSFEATHISFKDGQLCCLVCLYLYSRLMQNCSPLRELPWNKTWLCPCLLASAGFASLWEQRLDIHCWHRQKMYQMSFSFPHSSYLQIPVRMDPCLVHEFWSTPQYCCLPNSLLVPSVKLHHSQEMLLFWGFHSSSLQLLPSRTWNQYWRVLCFLFWWQKCYPEVEKYWRKLAFHALLTVLA